MSILALLKKNADIQIMNSSRQFLVYKAWLVCHSTHYSMGWDNFWRSILIFKYLFKFSRDVLTKQSYLNQPRNIAEQINKVATSEFVLTHCVVCKYVGKTWEACQESFVSFLPVLMCLLDVTSSNAQHWILCWLLRYGNEPQWVQIIYDTWSN